MTGVMMMTGNHRRGEAQAGSLLDAWRQYEGLLPELRDLHFTISRLVGVLGRLDASLIERGGIFAPVVARVAARGNKTFGRYVFDGSVNADEIEKAYNALRTLGATAGVYVPPLQTPPPVEEWWGGLLTEGGTGVRAAAYEFLEMTGGHWDETQSMRTPDKYRLVVAPGRIADDGSLRTAAK